MGLPAFSFPLVFHAALRLLGKTALWRLYTTMPLGILPIGVNLMEAFYE
jgi:hypothetical protein